MLGNMDVFELDRTGDGDYADDAEKENRTHNTVNEIDSQAYIYDVTNLANGDNLPVLLDDALHTGSMTNSRQLAPTAGAPLVYYTHDAWDRLVKVTVGSDVRAEYEYNGLGWRTVKRADTDGDTTLDQRRVMYYDQSWRLLQESVADGFNVSSATDRIRQYVWGDRYIDDLVHSRQNENFGNDGFGITYEDKWHHLTDAMFSAIAVVDAAGALVERVAYTPYGKARHMWATDVDGDGAGGQTSDSSAVTAALTKGIHQSGYNADADVNRDGVVDATDGSLVSGGTLTELVEGEISGASGVDSVVGYDGYILGSESMLWIVRIRLLSSAICIWIERDPLGAMSNSLNLYLYSSQAPLSQADPLGLLDCEPVANAARPARPNCVTSHDWGDQDVQNAITRAVSACGSRPVTISCASCNHCGRTTPGTGAIQICDPLPASCGPVRETIIHELTHARQNCTSGAPPPCNAATSGNHTRMCREYDAYDSEPGNGGCANGPGEVACLCQQACASVLAACPTSYPNAAACVNNCKANRNRCVGGVWR